jgi:Xaa-Pro aminopeptidase
VPAAQAPWKIKAMSAAAVTSPGPAAPTAPEINLSTALDRRADVDAKQARVTTLLLEVGCDGLLVLEPGNFAWLTSGGVARGLVDPSAAPCLYFAPEGRWVIAGNVDTQRLFDEELDGLGFQLKEWPWHQGRGNLLADLMQGRKAACDQPLGTCPVVAGQLRNLRRTMTSYEQACYRALGQLLGHALEATCRTLSPGETEREVAGQLSHRLLHRGAAAVLVSVMADGRSRAYRQGEYTSAPIRTHGVLLAVARKYGLYAMASRSVAFGQPEASFRKEHDAACRVSATYTASTWPDAMPRQVLATAQHVYQVSGAEHEWRLCPQGHITGRAPVELALLPQTEELLQAGWAVTWRASVGAALSCDTFLVSEEGPRTLTVSEQWPLKRIRVQGAEFVRPDLLIR